MARNTCYFEMNQDYEDLDLSRRVLRLGADPIGALLIAGNLNPRTVDAIASLISITLDRYRSFAALGAEVRTSSTSHSQAMQAR
jgi:two-component system sensor histidine kinase KdpD